LYHGGIDAALFIRKNMDQIRRYRRGGNWAATLSWTECLFIIVPNRLEAKFSLEYTVARALHSGAVRLGHFSEEAVNEPPVKSLMERMKWVDKYPMHHNRETSWELNR